MFICTRKYTSSHPGLAVSQAPKQKTSSRPVWALVSVDVTQAHVLLRSPLKHSIPPSSGRLDGTRDAPGNILYRGVQAKTYGFSRQRYLIHGEADRCHLCPHRVSVRPADSRSAKRNSSVINVWVRGIPKQELHCVNSWFIFLDQTSGHQLLAIHTKLGAELLLLQTETGSAGYPPSEIA